MGTNAYPGANPSADSDSPKPIHRALISVSDKRGIVDFARQLAGLGVEILSTGGTAKQLRDAAIVVIDVAEYTGFPEMMAGRVKTLHPKVHGGVLGRRGIDDSVMRDNGILPIDLVVVNLYPFAATIERPDCTFEEAIENIDIGGPAMVRSAAKNHTDVTVVVDVGDYAEVIDALAGQQGTGAALRRRLAAKAFAHTADYDAQIAAYLTSQAAISVAEDGKADVEADVNRDAMPPLLSLSLSKVAAMRYGENPHQSAALYMPAARRADAGTHLANANIIQGKALSYNNIADADAALQCVRCFQSPTCVIVKHANPCGVASRAALVDAYDSAYATDPTSAFGGIIAFNDTVDAATATAIVDRQFVEVVVAPEFDEAACDVFAGRPNVRVLKVASAAAPNATGSQQDFDLKVIDGGVLVQSADAAKISAEDFNHVSRRTPSAAQAADLVFAWRVVKYVKSNAIVFARDAATIGVGAGQMSRVYSTRIAAIKAADAGLEVAGSVMASDAFFPFRDGIDQAADVGISAVIQPGGSQRDAEVIAAVNEHDMAMVFTGVRHFRH